MGVPRDKKSPIAAALMAILPGLGHFYLQDVFSGILYLIFFWLGLAITFWYLSENHISLMYLWVFAAIWGYGIFDAYRDCVNYNEKVEKGEE